MGWVEGHTSLVVTSFRYCWLAVMTLFEKMNMARGTVSLDSLPWSNACMIPSNVQIRVGRCDDWCIGRVAFGRWWFGKKVKWKQNRKRDQQKGGMKIVKKGRNNLQNQKMVETSRGWWKTLITASFTSDIIVQETVWGGREGMQWLLRNNGTRTPTKLFGWIHCSSLLSDSFKPGWCIVESG